MLRDAEQATDMTPLHVVVLTFAAAIGAGTGGALTAWWLLGRAYDQGYRTGLTDRQPNPAHTRQPRAFRLPRMTR